MRFTARVEFEIHAPDTQGAMMVASRLAGRLDPSARPVEVRGRGEATDDYGHAHGALIEALSSFERATGRSLAVFDFGPGGERRYADRSRADCSATVARRDPSEV